MFNCIYKDKGREYPYFDCYGFVKWLYKKHNDIDIVDFEYKSANNCENEKLYLDSLQNPRWKEVIPQKGAIVVLKVNGYISHIGFMVSDKEFAHIMDGNGVMISKTTSNKWKNRIVGYYKYA